MFSNVYEVRKGLFECMDNMLDYNKQLTTEIRLDLFDQVRGEFESHVAIDSRKLRSPTSWWMHFVASIPEL